jgi:hypothetical protein
VALPGETKKMKGPNRRFIVMNVNGIIICLQGWIQAEEAIHGVGTIACVMARLGESIIVMKTAKERVF